MPPDAIMHFSGGQLTVDGVTGTAGIFSTYPADYLSLWGGVVDQVRTIVNNIKLHIYEMSS